MAERWLSVDEIAAPLGVNPDTIYGWDPPEVTICVHGRICKSAHIQTRTSQKAYSVHTISSREFSHKRAIYQPQCLTIRD